MPAFLPVEDIVVPQSLNLLARLLEIADIRISCSADFSHYRQIRKRHGESHLNQALDPRHAVLGANDFWLLAENRRREAIATYCLRRFEVPDFFDLVRSQRLWFAKKPPAGDRRYVVDCAIAPFGGAIIHGGGLWVREDYRGVSRLALILPHLARAMALARHGFDHDSAMIRDVPGQPANANERRAKFMGRIVYGYARVERFVEGWFPPEKRNALMHLCHSTRAEAVASLARVVAARADRGASGQLGQRPFVDQHDQPVYAPAVLGDWQDQARI